MTRLAWIALALGLLLRGLSCAAHEAPRGDVLLDVGTARSLVAGEGFASGFTRGVVSVPGDQPVPPQGHSDQHPPLWPLLGALLTPLAGDPFSALQLLSFVSGLGLLLLLLRAGDRLVEDLPDVPDGVGLVAAAVVSCAFVAVDAAGNGSLYALQALLVLGLVELLAAPRPRPLACGLVLGATVLLNHQALVLLPLPLAVLVLGSGHAPGARGRGVWVGLQATAVALACQLPWWLRNDALFGSPFHSVNGMYLSYWAGGAVSFAVEQGQPVQRIGAVALPVMARAMVGFARMNGLYLLVAGLAAAPCLGALAAASAPAALARGVRHADRRHLGLVLATAALLTVALVWPATKLRYLVALVPLVTLLGLSAWVRACAASERLGTWAALALWALAVVFTLDDATGSADDARPLRFALLVLGGGLCWALPLWRWRAGADRARGLAWASGLPVTLALGLAVALGPVLPGAAGDESGAAIGTAGGSTGSAGDQTLAEIAARAPALGTGTAYHGTAYHGTAYHGTWFLPDAFGQDAEARDARRAELLAAARAAALDAGLTILAGPVDLLAWAQPALLELPRLQGEPLAQSLRALARAGAMDGVVLEGSDGAPDDLASLSDLLTPLARFGGERGPWVGLFAVRAP